MQCRDADKWDYETFEHVVPRKMGGTNAMDNLALAHKRCNNERGCTPKDPLLRRVHRNVD